VEPLVEFLRTVSTFLGFWFEVFQRAASAVWHLANDRKISSLAFVIAVFLVGALVKYVSSGKQTAMEYVKYGLAPLLIVLFIAFVYQLLVTPAKLYTEQRDQVNKLTERCQRLVRQVPSPGLNADQQQRFKAIIEPLAGRTVLIEYLDDPYSRSQELVDSLRDVFRSAEWQVTVKKSDAIPVKGLNIRFTISPSGKGQLAVIEAFKAIGMSYGMWSSSDDVSDGRVELVIGEL
jgi:hypothetical protein